MPDGVANVVVGTGPVAGARLVERPAIAKVSFTGSTAVGRILMAAAAPTIKRLTLELGGKAANIISADAELATAAAAAVPAAYGNAGQDCCSRARILVQRAAYDDLLTAFIAAVGSWKVGDPEDPDTDMGPLVSRQHLHKVASYLDGGEATFQATTPPGHGFWFPPTVVALDDPGLRIARGDLRTHRGRYPVRGRGRRRADRERLRLRTVRICVDARRRAGAAGRARGSGRRDALDGYTDVKNVFISTSTDNR